jgi:translation initiation factor 2 beta subunit (eIF-2beta)/eIF-5
VNGTSDSQNVKKKGTAQNQSTASSEEVEKKLLELTKDRELVNKLLALGEPFKSACRVLKYNITPGNGSNPILAFVLQDYVKDNLLNTGILNANTFKAIYNAVAKKLVADSEFFTVNSYNIIYCKDLYKKTTVDIEKYLILQSQILKVSASKYTANEQEFNRKVFIKIPSIKEADAAEYAKLARSAEVKGIATNNATAILNSLDLAEKIRKSTKKIAHSSENQDIIVNKLNTSEELVAAILSLSLSTDSAKAKEAVSNNILAKVNSGKIIAALNKIVSDEVLPKGQLQASDADSLADKILTKLQKLQYK